MKRWSFFLVCTFAAGLAGSLLVAPLVLHGQTASAVAVPKELPSYRSVVKKVLPAVVSIETKAKARPVKGDAAPKRRPRVELPPGVPDEFRKFFEDHDGMPFDSPEDAPQAGFGSGFVIDAKGIILTNYHVVAGADQVEITFQDGRRFVSKDIKGDRKTDLAIVKIDPKGSDLPHLELGDCDQMEIGDRVLAVGAPFGLTGTVTSGIVSAKGRNGLNMNMYEDFIQTDAAINPGNSGGPLVNLAGQVIGINAAIKSRSGGFQGIGLAVNSNLAKTVVQQLEKDGVVHRGYLGVQIKDLEPEVAARLDLKDKGVLVAQVFENTPADKAGLKAGDIVLSLNGKTMKDGRELQRVVASLPLKKPVELAILRDGKPLTLKVTIEEQPDQIGSARVPTPRRGPRARDGIKLEKIGIEVGDLTPEMAEKLGFKDSASGAVVNNVDADGPAESALHRGMLIVKVDNKAVTSAADVKAAVDKADLAKGVLFQVRTPQGGTNYVVVKVEAAAATK
jgi:serine protease Do